MKYKCVIGTKRGGPEVLQVIEKDLRPPSAGEARIKILAAPVCAPDISARYGQSPFAPTPPYTPGYAINWATLFKLLEDGKIKPVIMKKYPILEAKEANQLLESGQVNENIVLLAPELL